MLQRWHSKPCISELLVINKQCCKHVYDRKGYIDSRCLDTPKKNKHLESDPTKITDSFQGAVDSLKSGWPQDTLFNRHHFLKSP